MSSFNIVPATTIIDHEYKCKFEYKYECESEYEYEYKYKWFWKRTVRMVSGIIGINQMKGDIVSGLGKSGPGLFPLKST